MVRKVYSQDEFYDLLRDNPMNAEVFYDRVTQDLAENIIVITLIDNFPMLDVDDRSLYKQTIQINYYHRDRDMASRATFLQFMHECGIQFRHFPYWDYDEEIYIERCRTQIIFDEFRNDVVDSE